MPASQPSRHAGNVAADLTTFVGRRHELAAIKRQIADSRLVTLTGVGGAGKTRLALRLAADLHRNFPDGVFVVELAALDDPELLAQSIASALGVQDRTGRWQARDIADYLSDHNLLLVLDNCEHLREPCAVLAHTVLSAAPELRILATSRQALGLIGEHIFQVPPMSVPQTDPLPPLEAMPQYGAVSLFTDRAAAVQPSFTLTEANYESVIRICQRLDGIPLALELTAVRLPVLSLEEILERLDDRYRLLTSGSPGARPAHQTLRALIDWSSGLCTTAERALWARLSIFSGDFALEAAEAICADEEIDEGSVFDLLASLVDKSIVVADTYDERRRYRLLETIRQYGREMLAEHGCERALRERHLQYVEITVDDACAHWHGPDQQRWLGHLNHEHPNIRAALEFGLTNPACAERALRIAGGLWFFWIATGHTSEGRRWLERGLALDLPQGVARARALWVCAYLCVIQEDVDAARRLIDECRGLAELLDDADAAAWVVQLSGMVAMSDGDLATAQELLETAMRRHRARGNTIGVLDDSFYLIAVTALLRELHQAAARCEEALALCDTHGERWLKAYLLWDLGLVAWQLGDTKRAAASGRDALRLARAFNEQWAIAFCVELLGWAANADLNQRRAARLLGAADSIWQRVGAPLFGMQHLSTYHASCVARVHESLGDEAFDAEFSAGGKASLGLAISYALEEPDLSEGGAAGPGSAAATGAATGTADPLTPREREVAALVSQGLSNKAIAAHLVIAPRTAEAHVEHILGKLGFSSRAQVAAWVAERRPAGTAEDSVSDSSHTQ